MRPGPRDTRATRPGPAEPTPLWRLEQAIHAWPSPEAREWARRMVQTACANPSVLAIVAIGSGVRQVSAPHDVDFLLVYEASEPPRLGPLPLDVDVRPYEASTVNDKVASGHDLLGGALRFGVLIHERHQYWSGLTERWAHRLPLPSAEQASERAARAHRLTEELRDAGDQEAAAEQRIAWLTHDARARLIRAGIHPASRPELAAQLRRIGAHTHADALESALADRLRMSGG